jgi:hypothetical protein
MAKDKKYAFRISQADLDEIRKKAAQANMTVTAYLTSCALRKRIVVVEGLDPIYRQIKGIGGNLNQLTVLCRMGRITCPRLTEVTEGLAEVYSQLVVLSGGKH